MESFPLKFGEKLKAFRLSLPGSPSLEKFGAKVGANKGTLSRYELGETEPDVSFLQRVVDLYGASAAPLIPGAEILTPTQVTGALPEHVAAAYKIIREALDAAKVDISTMDQDRVGLVIGLAAEEVAKGNQEETRRTLRRRAEVLLGLANP
jgi:transcriptional regulator with XRE-family HTH domain